MELSPANYLDWKKASQSFDGLGVFDSEQMNLVGQGEPERLIGASVSADLLPMLGAKKRALGRLFTAEDDRGELRQR